MKNQNYAFSPSQVLITLLASVVLLISTACNNTPSSQSLSRTDPNYEDRGLQKELYAPTQARKGGINEYNDDSRLETAKLESKARERVDSAKANLESRATNPKEALENLNDTRRTGEIGDKGRAFSRETGNSIQNSAEDFVEGTQRGMKNLQRNADRAVTGVERSADRAAKGVERRAEDASDFAQDQAQKAARAAQHAGEDTVNGVKNRA
jgi:hypothetical protein